MKKTFGIKDCHEKGIGEVRTKAKNSALSGQITTSNLAGTERREHQGASEAK